VNFSESYKQNEELSVCVNAIYELFVAASENRVLPLTRTAVCRNSDYLYIEIPQTYDKKYFTAEEYARSIGKHNFSSNIHVVRFQLHELNKISILLHCLGDKIGYGISLENMKYPEIVDFLNHNHSAYVLASELTTCLHKFGSAPSVYYAHPIVVARSFINQRRRELNKYVDAIYASILQDGKVPIKWKSEYQLYSIVKLICPDAIFQYHPEWLNKQSLDIYIPSKNIAIEYQGQQHYEPIGFFGGENSFSQVQIRDKRKADLCRQFGVCLLYWKYDNPISIDNLKDLLSSCGI